MIVECEFCGKEHYTKPSKYAAGMGRYCSNSCAAKARWRDKEYRAKQMITRNSKEFRARMSENASQMWDNGSLGSQEWKAHHSKIMIEIHKDIEYRQRISRIIKLAWAENRLGDDEWRAKNAEGKRRAWAQGAYDEERNRKVSKSKKGKKNPAWNGGSSTKPYTHGFSPKLKLQIRKRDNFACVLCGIPEDDIAHDCHHIDYSKTNHKPSNLVTLCKSCHSKTNHNRSKWPTKLRKLVQE